MTRVPPLNEIINVSPQIDDIDTKTHATGIKAPRGNKGASIRSTKIIREGQNQASAQPIKGNRSLLNNPHKIRMSDESRDGYGQAHDRGKQGQGYAF